MKYNHLAIFSEANVHLNNINTKLNCHLISTLRILGIICPITSMGSNQNIIRIVLFIFYYLDDFRWCCLCISDLGG